MRFHGTPRDRPTLSPWPLCSLGSIARRKKKGTAFQRPLFSARRQRLEVELCAELRRTARLRVTGVGAEAARVDGAQRLAKCRIAEVAVRLCKVGMVEDVVRLKAKLDVPRLAAQVEV